MAAAAAASSHYYLSLYSISHEDLSLLPGDESFLFLQIITAMLLRNWRGRDSWPASRSPVFSHQVAFFGTAE
ncbi:hypothetical protein Bca4012_094937 [Brassica carinata]|uniref:Uncharacterized protein n=2 Tax=Brassica cretica TaxID=69181 RepID=A0A3N6SCM4_BRACR|nr:hypothetical protein F2Q68_00041411 [Brassica cretica]KAF3494253.1 hypothetical protein DY000_02055965 [Brassica cretica]KAF3572888.1 hypothetical protein F2Q69_00061644 [Brassica cretica]